MSEAILERIRKLLALANDKGASENEASTAMKLAMGLMARHNIEEEALAKKDVKENLVKQYVSKEEFWHDAAFNASCHLFNCRMLFAGSRGYWAIGHESHVAAALLTFPYITNQVERLYKQALPRGMTKSDRANFRRTFKDACARRVAVRAMELMAELRRNDEEAKAATGSTALVVASMMDRQLREVDDFMKTAFDKIGVRNVKGRSGGLGTAAGDAAGHKVNLSRQVTGSSNNAPRLK